MHKFLPLLVLAAIAGLLRAEIHTMNLREAVARALNQNSDLALARLDEQKAEQAVRIAKAPFSPSIVAGSGLAYANGFPMTMEGAAPAIVQARATQFVFNRHQSYAVASARENVRGLGIATSAKRDEIAYRTAAMFLDAQRAARLLDLARKQLASLEKVGQATEARVAEGRELPIESKRAALNLARARQRVEQLADDQDAAERSLAVVLGFNAEDQVRAGAEDPPAPPIPASEEAAIHDAIQSSKELRRLESALIAKGLDIRGQKAARLPTLDLIGQYGLFSKFNHYADYFKKFQRSNGEIGVAFTIPLLPGPGLTAGAAYAEAEAAHLRSEMSATRNRISLDTRQSYRLLKKAETARDVARLDLEVARDQVSLLLAQMNEGRASLQQLEEARFAEDEKWIAFYDVRYAAEKAAWDLLRQTGSVLAALQ